MQWVGFLEGKPIRNGHSASTISNIMSIISIYKIPSHLTHVQVLIQSLEQAHNGLVMKGVDSVGRTQYYYGKQYILRRNSNRLVIITWVHKIWPYLTMNIRMLLASNSSFEVSLGLALYIATKIYIRTGTPKYEVTGLIGLQSQHISLSGNILRLDFIGKDLVHQVHELVVDSKVSDIIRLRLSGKSRRQYLFQDTLGKRLKHTDIYEHLAHYNVHLKDIRTYGVNMLFIYNVTRSLNSVDISKLTERQKRILIAGAIATTANSIGHTKNVCKRSYIALQIIESISNLQDTDYISVLCFLIKLNSSYNHSLS